MTAEQGDNSQLSQVERERRALVAALHARAEGDTPAKKRLGYDLGLTLTRRLRRSVSDAGGDPDAVLAESLDAQPEATRPLAARIFEAASPTQKTRRRLPPPVLALRPDALPHLARISPPRRAA